MKYILTIIIIYSSLKSMIAQVVIDYSNAPIPYVDIIISRDNSIYWQTDINGKIPAAAINKMSINDTLIFSHIAYDNRRFSYVELMNLDKIVLQETQYKLKEVAISAKLPKYQKLSACFRHAVFQNGIPIYYSDGDANYLTKTKNVKYKLLRNSYRAFENKEIRKYLNDYNTSIPINKAYTPILEEKYLPHLQAKKHKLIFNTKDSSLITILAPDSVQVGHILTRDNYIEYQFNNVFELKKRKALNTEVETKDYFIYMVFRKNAYKSSLETLQNYNDLLYYKCNYGQSFKHDKNSRIKYMKSIEEIFVKNVSFINFESDDYSNQRGMPNKSNFTNKFWEDCDCEFYYQQEKEFFELLEIL
ncbi:MAG: hypothetical protein CMC96_13125 [Flavobacteriales bacterium]|nr:hypothetical protein [Flavobacteriales bacterium]|tara:strand:- start:396 stop:1475 length:1080 start_codon:yes stop_codon:yes gene_type:complete